MNLVSAGQDLTTANNLARRILLDFLSDRRWSKSVDPRITRAVKRAFRTPGSPGKDRALSWAEGEEFRRCRTYPRSRYPWELGALPSKGALFLSEARRIFGVSPESKYSWPTLPAGTHMPPLRIRDPGNPYEVRQEQIRSSRARGGLNGGRPREVDQDNSPVRARILDLLAGRSPAVRDHLLAHPYTMWRALRAQTGFRAGRGVVKGIARRMREISPAGTVDKASRSQHEGRSGHRDL